MVFFGVVKSANVILARDLSRIKLCDLGVSIPLQHDLSCALRPGCQYEVRRNVMRSLESIPFDTAVVRNARVLSHGAHRKRF